LAVHLVKLTIFAAEKYGVQPSVAGFFKKMRKKLKNFQEKFGSTEKCSTFAIPNESNLLRDA
jgi:hypothetical protein